MSKKFIADCEKWIDLPAIVLISLSIRLWALHSWCAGPYGDFLVWDEQVYHRWAVSLCDGTLFPAVYDFTPLYAHLMAWVYTLFSATPVYVRILNVILGISLCGLIYHIGKEMAGRSVGLSAGLAACLYKPFIFYSVSLMKTSLALFLFALCVCMFLATFNRVSFLRMLCMGAAAGLLVNVRANAVLMIPFLPAGVFVLLGRNNVGLKRAAALSAAYVLGLCACIMPFALKTYRTSGELSLTACGGFNFYIGNHSGNPYPYYRPVPFASSSPLRQAAEFIIEARRRTGEELSPRQASSFWVSETMSQFYAHPESLLKKAGLKTLALFNRFESADNYHIGFISRFVPFLALPFLEFWMIIPFGMAGMAAYGFCSSRTMWLSLLTTCYAITLIIIFTNVRIRLPMMIFLIPMAVIGIQRTAAGIREKRFKQTAAYFFVAAVFSIITFLPLKGTDDLSSHYNTHAVLLHSKGLKAEAVQYWQASSGMGNPYSAFADLALSEWHLSRGDAQTALEYLDRIPDGSFAAAYKFEKKGDILIRQGAVENALGAYEKSFDINSGQAGVIRKLIRLYGETDVQKAVLMESRLRRVLRIYQEK